ncbi:hypothetical protein C2S52_012868, partial [Perilla frutescens var. hirtella]
MPFIRYISGDSVSLTIAQSDEDFNYFAGNHQRVADEFYAFVPELPPSRIFPDSVIFPVIAIQITLFPGQGFCIGITNLHAVSDESSTINFVKSWALVNRFEEKAEAASAEKMNDNDDEEPVHFSFAADCRERLNPPLPESYFGNCLVFVIAECRRGLLKKKDGFLIAAEIIGKEIRRVMHSDKGVLETADWPMDFGKSGIKCVVSVAGSPRLDVYEADFGWGKAKKQEF